MRAHAIFLLIFIFVFSHGPAFSHGEITENSPPEKIDTTLLLDEIVVQAYHRFTAKPDTW